jgi:hypothetical protein
VDEGDLRVIERGEKPGFALEASEAGGVECEGWRAARVTARPAASRRAPLASSERP